MYTLLTGLYEIYNRKEDYFIVILGLDNAGKTTLLEKIKSIFNHVKGLSPEQIGPTVGMNMGKIIIGNSKLNFWDLGGQQHLLSLWDKYYSTCDGIIFVVDSTDTSRIEEVNSAFEGVMKSDLIGDVPVLMLANKQDLPEAMQLHDIQTIFNQIALKLNARDSKILAVSALEGNGVEDAIKWLQSRLRPRLKEIK